MHESLCTKAIAKAIVYTYIPIHLGFNLDFNGEGCSV